MSNQIYESGQWRYEPLTINSESTLNRLTKFDQSKLIKKFKMPPDKLVTMGFQVVLVNGRLAFIVGSNDIEWTGGTINPFAGCKRISPGCLNCYALGMSARLQGMAEKRDNPTPSLAKYTGTVKAGRNGLIWTDTINYNPNEMDKLKKLSSPKMFFVNSMSDTFHEKVPMGWIRQLFDVMNNTTHIYQLLTKRAERLAKIASDVNYTPNIWQGVSVESGKYKWRIDYLRQVPARVRFLSIEPLIGDLGDVDLEGIHQVVVGGESGKRSRPIDPVWVRSIRDQCIEQGVPFFFKQWGGIDKKSAGDVLDGRVYYEMPLAYEE